MLFEKQKCNIVFSCNKLGMPIFVCTTHKNGDDRLPTHKCAVEYEKIVKKVFGISSWWEYEEYLEIVEKIPIIEW